MFISLKVSEKALFKGFEESNPKREKADRVGKPVGNR